MPTPITKKGYDALKAELDRLRKVERPQVIEAIAEARAHGDLSENAEYDAAKERQGFIEARIAEIREGLIHAEGFATQTISLYRDRTMRIVMERGFALAGVVVDASDKPVAKAKVELDFPLSPSPHNYA